MRSRVGLLILMLATSSVLATCRATAGSDRLPRFKLVVSDFVASTESRTRRERLLRTSLFKAEDDAADEDEEEERLIDSSATAKLQAELEAINMKLNFRDWFKSKKTLEQVRAFLGLPAKGEAVSHANWTAFQNYLKYVQEMEEHAAKMARAAAAKQRLEFKGWYLEGKSFKQVRAILGLPEKGPAPDHANWQIFVDYLKFFKEFSQQFPH